MNYEFARKLDKLSFVRSVQFRFAVPLHASVSRRSWYSDGVMPVILRKVLEK